MAAAVTRTIEVPGQAEYLKKVREIISRTLEESVPERMNIHAIVLAVDEAVSNIVEHAYLDAGKQGDVRITLTVDRDTCMVVLEDTGERFNPTDGCYGADDVERHIMSGKKKGLGLFLMRKIMDEIRYEFRRGYVNTLTMVKYLNGS